MPRVEISEGGGLSVSVRKGKIETIEQNKDKGMGVTVFIGQSAAIATRSTAMVPAKAGKPVGPNETFF